MVGYNNEDLQNLDSAAVSIFVVILVELTNTVFVNSTNITTNIETAVLSSKTHHIFVKGKFLITVSMKGIPAKLTAVEKPAVCLK